MLAPDQTSPRLSLTTLPLEILRIVLDKVYEDPHTLRITRPLRSYIRTNSDLPTTSLLVNRHIYAESLDAIRRSKNNIASVKLHTTVEDMTTIPPSPSLDSFFSSVTTLTLVDFPYDSSVLKSWKQICPNLQHVNVERAYSAAKDDSLHRMLLTPEFTTLLRGDIDTDFATTAIERILHYHPEFNLDDLGDIRLTFPNYVEFWLPKWEKEYYHENRVLILCLTITRDTTFISQKYFKNRHRSMRYQPPVDGTELPRFPGVDYDVRFKREGSQPNLDYDYINNFFRSPYSPAGVNCLG